ncbi:Cathepsin L [Gryllus bimaculatus]|nr:Cathepsin L [Gryllus bimaculatus]
MKGTIATPWKTPPVFSDSYTVKGTLYIPYAEIREPFYAWYDLQAGSSRIDYYGGMVKTYQLSTIGKFGVMRKIVPVTTETQMNVDSCLQVNGSKEFHVQPQSILPDLSQFKWIGQDMVAGVQCDKWRLVDRQGDKVSKYTMWVRTKRSVGRADLVVPIRYEMKGYNSLLGSHYDHYYLEYEWFSAEVPSPEVFRLRANETCGAFPGPGDRHLATFNPMREFVHGDDAHNRAGLGFSLDINHLADRSDIELKALRGRQYTKQASNGGLPFPHATTPDALNAIPDNLDWRLLGAVTPVKDQSVCGSCWSFGTTGTIEGAYFLKYHKQVRLSQQALIDCSWGFGNNGCDGGEDFRSYDWMMKHGGLPSEDEYGPYLGQDGYCHIDKVKPVAAIKGFVNVTSGDEKALKVAVAKQGPISIAIDASKKTFTFYANGIYYDPECGNQPDQLDHAVLLVGYGKLNGKPYWLVKNSWSNYWGNDGYVLMSPKNNNCGVMTDPTYVLM